MNNIEALRDLMKWYSTDKVTNTVVKFILNKYYAHRLNEGGELVLEAIHDHTCEICHMIAKSHMEISKQYRGQMVRNIENSDEPLLHATFGNTMKVMQKCPEDKEYDDNLGREIEIDMYKIIEDTKREPIPIYHSEHVLRLNDKI